VSGVKVVPQPWLVGVKRRTLEDIKARLGLEQIFNLITSKTWNYKTDMENYYRRDRCLMALLFLTAGRISEVLSLTREQFDFQADSDFIIIRNMILVKRLKTRKGKPVKHTTSPIRDEVALPRLGPLSKFTELIEDYVFSINEPKAKLFNFGRRRAWQIVRFITDQWCHWFRSQAESYYGRYVYTSAFALRDFVGVTDIESLGPYVKTSWRDYEDKLLGKKPKLVR
jgi:integrase